MPGLIVMAPPAQGSCFTLSPQHDAVIGREGYCDVVLMKRTISRKHARVFFDGEQYRVEDLGSAHGTFLNGRRVSKAAPLRDGDRINIFDIPITFSAANAPFMDTSQFTLGATQSITLTPPPPTRTQTAMLAYSNRLHSLLEITRRLGSSLTLEDLFPRVLDLLFDIFPQAAVGEIQLVDTDGELKPVAMKYGRDDDSSVVTRVPVGSDFAKQVLLTGQPLMKSVESDEESVLDVSGSNTLCVPIAGPSHTKLGTILLETSDDHRVFTEDDVELIGSIGIITGQAIEYAKQHATMLLLDQTQRQLETARQIQLRMLPRQRPNLPGYVFEDHYVPAESVGGDFYFWDELPDGRVMLGIADACGKSLPAALLMAQFATELRHCLAAAETLKEAMVSLNRFVCELDEGFITFCLCLLDANTHLLSVANAGHPAPLCRRHETTEVEELDLGKSGLPFGIRSNERFHAVHVLLQPGDQVFLFTDGVTETMAPDNSLFGADRLKRLLASPYPRLASRMRAIAADLVTFQAGRRSSDDCCMLGIARELT